MFAPDQSQFDNDVEALQQRYDGDPFFRARLIRYGELGSAIAAAGDAPPKYVAFLRHRREILLRELMAMLTERPERPDPAAIATIWNLPPAGAGRWKWR